MRAAFLLFLLLFGIASIRAHANGSAEKIWVFVGWGLVVFALYHWRGIVDGLRRGGKFAFVVLVIAALAAFVSGERGLWETFF
jgi:hypothetical protein